MKYILIEYPKCSTCKKAKKFLQANGYDFTTRHILEETPSITELTEWIHKSNRPIQTFFNTSGNLYKEWNLKETLKDKTEEEKIALLSQNGMLIKRPLLIGEDVILSGFKSNEWQKLKH